MKNNKSKLILWGLIFLPYLLLIPATIWYFKKMDNISNSSIIIISKQEMMLYQYSYKGDLLQKSPIATGKSFGNKDTKGDMKTPEGVFQAINIEDASTWSHDFKDGYGNIKGAYGPYFIRLDVPEQKGIGIHGTHDNSSLGKRASEGCVRIKNADLIKLVEKIRIPSVVIITPGLPDIQEDFGRKDSLMKVPNP